MKKLFVYIILFIISMHLTGCTLATAKTSSSKLSVTHEVKYTNKGTRSEGRSGYLKINDIVIPDCFTLVVADNKAYYFITKNTLWGDDGYFPVADKPAEFFYPAVNKSISDSDLARCWIEVEGRYLNIPANWIFVKWYNGSAAVSPEKIDEFVKSKSFSRIPRNTMYDFMK
mgnify:FL=1